MNINETIMNGRVLCGNALCKRKVGIHVLLFNYRKCQLVHVATRVADEDGESSFIVINQLVEKDGSISLNFGVQQRRIISNSSSAVENAAPQLDLETFVPITESSTVTVDPLLSAVNASEIFDFELEFFNQMVNNIIASDSNDGNSLKQLVQDNNETSFYVDGDQLLVPNGQFEQTF